MQQEPVHPFKSIENQLEVLFEIYMQECEYTRKLSPYTLKNYRDVFRTLTKVVPEIKTLDDLDPTILNIFFHRLGTRKKTNGAQNTVGVKLSTISTYFNKLMTFFRWLEDQNYLSKGYITKSTRKPRTPSYTDERALPKEDISKIVAAIMMHTLNNTFLNKRDMAIVHTLLYTGIRRGELLGLRIQDIDLHNRHVFINKETSKSKHDRYIPLNPILIHHLRAYLDVRSEIGNVSPALFISKTTGNVLTRHGLKHWVKRYKDISGVSFHLHRFRHTFACTMAEQGAGVINIMKLLGHTSIRMTVRYLRSISTEDVRDYIDQIGF